MRYMLYQHHTSTGQTVDVWWVWVPAKAET